MPWRGQEHCCGFGGWRRCRAWYLRKQSFPLTCNLLANSIHLELDWCLGGCIISHMCKLASSPSIAAQESEHVRPLCSATALLGS
jgi:hypothetical protein